MRTVSDVVAANVARLRAYRGLTVRQLSEQLGQLSYPMLASGITKIEKGERKVTVADLVALALALDVSPVRLLLPGGDEHDETSPDALLSPAGEPVELTRNVTASWEQVWQWATGDAPLDEDSGPGERLRWLRLNRPHDDAAIVAAYVAAIEDDQDWTVERDECGRPTALIGPWRRWDATTGPAGPGRPIIKRSDVPESLPALALKPKSGADRERPEAT